MEPTTVNDALMGGVQRLYEMSNGYTVSAVCHDFSYGGPEGLWEIAIFVDGEITYDVDLTSNGGVKGWLTEDDLQLCLIHVAFLPQRTTPCFQWHTVGNCERQGKWL